MARKWGDCFLLYMPKGEAEIIRRGTAPALSYSLSYLHLSLQAGGCFENGAECMPGVLTGLEVL